jgi:hypothetical protein
VTEGAVGSRISGSVFFISEYEPGTTPQGAGGYSEGVRAGQLAHIPMPAALTSRHLRNSPLHDFSREKDFIRLMPKLSELDINDPRNDHLLCLLLAAGGAINGRNVVSLSSAFSSDKDIFRLAMDEYSLLLSEQGVSYANYIKFQQGIRIKLLQLRSKKPHLFAEPIPLSDGVLKRSDLYKSLLRSAYPGDDVGLVPEMPRGKLLLLYRVILSYLTKYSTLFLFCRSLDN